MAGEKDETSRNYITIAGEVPGSLDKYAIAVNPITKALIIETGGGIPPALPSSLQSGTIIMGGSAEQLSIASVPLVDGVLVQNNVNNANDIWVGKDATVAIDNGVLLTPGEGVPLAINDLNKVWIIGTATQKVNFIGG